MFALVADHSKIMLLRLFGEQMRYRVIIEQDEDGVFVAECPALPGCISQGKSREEAVTNIKDAIAGYLESLRQHGEPVPLPITEEIVEVG
jgi:antitoxin HicB